MRLALALLSAGIVAGLAGCQREHPSIAIGEDVIVEQLDAGRYAARFEARVVSKGKHSGLDHAAALLTAGGHACDSGSLQVQSQSPDLGAKASVPPAGTTLTMTVACRHDRLPGHRVVTEAEALAMSGPALPGSSNRSGYLSMRANETRVQSADALIGGFVREAYTEECGGQSLVVERIEMASVPREPGSDAPYVENLHAVMHFRCVDASPPEPQS